MSMAPVAYSMIADVYSGVYDGRTVAVRVLRHQGDLTVDPRKVSYSLT
jgi:hypothetical protein